MKTHHICRILLLAFTGQLLVACGGGDLGAGFADVPDSVAPKIGSGPAGVSSAHPLASQAGNSMLEAGGNAVDAAVATGFVLAVVENSMSGLGGRTQILVRDSEGQISGIDAQTQLGSDYSSPWLRIHWSGIETVGVPGLVAGLLDLHKAQGSLPLEQVMAPAIRYAEEGFPLSVGEASRHQRAEEHIRKDAVLSEIYLNNEAGLHTPGTLFKQADLAKTLQTIAQEGSSGFYAGPIAQRMASDIAGRGGSVRLSDIESYRSKEARLVRSQYRGLEIVSMAAPANGTAVVAALNALSHIDMGSLDEAEWAVTINHVMAKAMTRTFFEDQKDEKLSETLGPQFAREIIQDIQEAPQLGLGSSDERHWNVTRQSLEMAHNQVDWSGASNGAYSHHTTHLVAADASGMVVTATQTLGPNMGSKVMTPGLGFLYAQTGGIPRWLMKTQPGDRPRTNLAPTILLKDGKPFLVLGAAGGTLIPSAVVQVISRIVDRGMSVEEAVAAPRLAPKGSILGRRFKADVAKLEMTSVNGWSAADQARLTELGVEVKPESKYALFGRVNAMVFDAERGLWSAVADPDWEGSVSMSVGGEQQ